MKKIFNGVDEHWQKFRKILYISIILVFGLYIFSTFAFSARDFFNYINIFISVILCILIFTYTIKYTYFRIDAFSILLFLFMITIFVSTLINCSLNKLSKSVFLVGFLAIVIYQFSKDRKSIKDLMTAALIGGIVFCIYYIVHYRNEIFSFQFINIKDRLGDFFDNQNGVAKDFIFISAISLYFICFMKKYWLIPVPVISALLLATTGSISNLLTLFLVDLFLLYAATRKKGRIIITCILVIFIVAFYFVIQIPQLSYFKDRIVNIFITLITGGNNNIDNSAHDRLEYALDGFKLFFSKPLFGFGPGGVMDFSSGGYAHNNFSELSADYGVFGILIFEIILIYPLLKINKKDDDLKYFVISMIIFIIWFQFFLVTFYTKLEYVILPISYGYLSENFTNKIDVKVDLINRKIIFNKSINIKTNVNDNYQSESINI